MITIYMSEDHKVFRIIRPDVKFFILNSKNVSELVSSFGNNFGYTAQF